MLYEMTRLPDLFCVDEICTVLESDYMKNGGIGESHNFPELIYITQGMTVGFLDGVELEKHAGQLVLIAPGTFHKKKRPTEGKGQIISFTSKSPKLSDLYNRVIDLCEEEREEFAVLFSLGARCFVRKPRGSRIGGMELSAEADPYRLECFKKRLELFLLDLHRRHAIGASEEKARETAELVRICHLLSVHMRENLSVEEIARLAGVSVSKLKRLFREKGGVLHTFICMKIERAKQLMLGGKMNFSEIADALGFASLHYFSRTFKAVTGVSPSQFKQLI